MTNKSNEPRSVQIIGDSITRDGVHTVVRYHDGKPVSLIRSDMTEEEIKALEDKADEWISSLPYTFHPGQTKTP